MLTAILNWYRWRKLRREFRSWSKQRLVIAIRNQRRTEVR